MTQRDSRRGVVFGLLAIVGAAMGMFAAPAGAQDSPKPAALAATATTADTGAKQATNPDQPAAAPAQAGPDSKSLLEDFLHYVLIDSTQAAAATGQQLIDRKLPAPEFVKVVESTGDIAKFENVIARAMRLTSLEPIAAQLSKHYETGLVQRARDPEQIAANIKALTSTLRAKQLAKERLKSAGEYAMPQLLGALLDGRDPVLRQEVRQQMSEMGRHAIIPLCTALSGLPPEQQETVADVLGTVPHRMSLPFLADLRASTHSPNVQSACQRAIEKLGGDGGVATNDIYVQLAEAYYAEKPEITSFPGEEHQLLWSYNPSVGGGLVMQAIKTPVFHEAMAMRLAERALVLKSENPEALSLWVASNLKREIQTPAGYANPAYPTTALPGVGNEKPRREAQYFAVAAGPGICQQVLARAMDTRNAPLARRAIAALEQTAGGSGLWGGSGSRHPLVEAVTFPNRRVQYDAALALAAAQPREGFAGAERVVPTLAGSIRDASTQTACVLAPDPETQQAVRKMLETAGFKVLAPGRAVEDLSAAIAESPAIDLVVMHASRADRVPEAISAVRASPKLAATPVFILTSTEGYIDLSRRYDSDGMVAVRQSAIGEPTFVKAVQALVQSATGGPISADEAAGYTTRSLAAMRDLAMSGNNVLNIADAATPLLGVLSAKDTPADTRLKVADILGRIDEERSQRTLMDTALASQGAERIALMNHVAGSAKRFGNKLESRHVTRVIELASTGADAEATAAAALLGSLNLPNAQLMPLILKK